MISAEELLKHFADVVGDRIVERLGMRQRIDQRLLSVEEAARYLGRTKEAVQHLVAAGKLPTVRIDRRVYLDIEDLDRLIEESKQGGLPWAA